MANPTYELDTVNGMIRCQVAVDVETIVKTWPPERTRRFFEALVSLIHATMAKDV